jgi:hypothetical protein
VPIRRRWLCILLLSLTSLLILGFVGQAQSSQGRVVINGLGIPDGSLNVEAYVSVLDGDGSAVTGLDPGAFSVLEDSVPVGAEISEEQVGLAVMILIDLSGSMREPGVIEGQDRLQSAKEIAEPFILDDLNPDDWVGVIGFHVDMPYKQELTQDHGAARNTVTQMAYSPSANTALLNTASNALDRLNAHPDRVMRKVLLIFSDGKDYLEETDPVAYEESREAVARKANEYGIQIYTVGIDSYCGQKGQRPGCVRNWPENAYESQDVAWLADQTHGGYMHYGGRDGDARDRGAVEAFLRNLVRHGFQYRIRYPTHAAKGQHELQVQVADGTTNAAAKATFYSPFELPTIRITAPPEGFSLDLSSGSTIHLEAAVAFPDGRPRDLEKVIFYDGSNAVATLSTSPYAYEWDVTALEGNRTLRAEAFDTVLRDRPATSDPVSVGVVPLPPPTPTPEPLIPPPPEEGKPAWFAKLVLDWLPLILVAAVIAVFVIILGLRRQIATGVKRTTTWVKRKTAILSSGGPALAKLIGPGGTQYRITGRLVAFGSEPHLCDEVILNDPFISGRHFEIIKETDTFYIVDTNSTNGTLVNGQPIVAGQRIRLADGALITAGQTNLQFRLGDVTMPLP